MRHTKPFRLAREFLALESAGGLIMLAAAAFALLLANSSFAPLYHHLATAPLMLGMDVSFFVQDVLMVIFFFAVGLELKNEMREGALAARGQKILPLLAAAGGVLLPALLYLSVTKAHPELQAGWAIPTATDIAFALCVLRLLGPSVPAAAKIFLLAIAIYDDLAAIFIIALFYAGDFALMPLLASGAILLGMLVLNRRHVDTVLPYLALGVALWFALHGAGIHPTIAGVATGMAIPLRRREGSKLLGPLLQQVHPYVAFLILPIFAFASAGVSLSGFTPTAAFSTLPLGIAAALFFGKQIGIFTATFLSVKAGIAPLPKGVSWHLVYGIAILGGIGFTMSLFIGQLAFPAQAQDAVKLGVLAGSVLSAAWGLIFLRLRRMS